MPTILKDKVTVSHFWGTYSFNDPATLGSDWPGAVDVRIDEIKGWSDSADLNVIKTPRGVGDGSYVADKFPAKERLLTVAGYVNATSRLTLDQVWNLLMIQGFPLDVDITFTRFEPIPKYVTARLAGPIDQVQYLGNEGALRFETMLLCADPFKYDAVSTITGGPVGVAGVSSGGRTYPRVYPLVYNITAAGAGNSMTLYNAGTATSPVVITITGPLPSGWRVENSTTGEQLSFLVDLTSALDTLVIDTYNKTATLNGASVTGLIAGTWWGLQPKANVIRLYGNYDPAADFSITAKSRWR